MNDNMDENQNGDTITTEDSLANDERNESLPEESRMFAYYQPVNTNDKVWDASEGGGGMPGGCARAFLANAMYNYPYHGGLNQQFIWFQLDDGRFAIANKHNGYVLQKYQAGDKISEIVNVPWENNYAQLWRKESTSATNFRLVNEAEALEVCGGNTSAQAKMSFIPNRPDNGLLFKRRAIAQNNVVPALPSKQPLPALPILSNLNDPAPHETARVITGSSLEPCIMVSDYIPVSQRIKESPYYILAKKQFWKLLWHDTFIPGEYREFQETTGMSKTHQESMTQTTNISLQADFGFAYKAITLGLGVSISKSIEISRSTTDTVMSQHTDTQGYKNGNNFNLSWAKYALATEFILMRKDGTTAGSWEAVDKKVTRSISYPPTQALSWAKSLGDQEDSTVFEPTTITSE
ncbi:RICIN domain-containing protein [Bacillus mycoides]|uniref:RICIN domain-containing protein n=1 Tax=Bacillus mycoides TaxID=1405 RepID=UPI002E1BD38F|nr:RICIN domain-containing protein [Bacillus mycoides]